MKRLYSIIYKCHKWFGLPLAIMFISWYCSGIVMMYHSFPRLSPSVMPIEKPDPETLAQLWEQVPDTLKSCKLSFSAGKLQIYTQEGTIGAYKPDMGDLQKIARSFGTSVQRVDTLSDLDKWTPFNRLTGHLPFYRIVGDDESYIYVSSKTGELVQRNTLSARRWAWIGALPHYVYITPLRRDASLWSKVVIWMAGLSTISVIFGLIIAFRFLIKKWKLRLFKRRSWQWHYSWSLFFGIFMLAFIFSGMMSLAEIPDWIMKSRQLAEPSSMSIAKSEIDPASIPEEFGQLILVTDPVPMWSVTRGRKNVTCAVKGERLNLSPDAIIPIIERQTGEKVNEVKEITEDFFYHRGGTQGWRAQTEHFSVYWNSKGYYRILDAKGKAQYICYRFLHKMRIPGLYQIKWLHEIYMWILLLGGLVIVITGAILSVRTLR